MKQRFHKLAMRLVVLTAVLCSGIVVESMAPDSVGSTTWAGPATEKDDPGSPWASPDNPVIRDGRVYDEDFYKTLVPALVFIMMGAVAFMFAVTFLRSRRRRRKQGRLDAGAGGRGEDGEW